MIIELTMGPNGLDDAGITTLKHHDIDRLLFVDANVVISGICDEDITRRLNNSKESIETEVKRLVDEGFVKGEDADATIEKSMKRACVYYVHASVGSIKFMDAITKWGRYRKSFEPFLEDFAEGSTAPVLTDFITVEIENAIYNRYLRGRKTDPIGNCHSAKDYIERVRSSDDGMLVTLGTPFHDEGARMQIPEFLPDGFADIINNYGNNDRRNKHDNERSKYNDIALYYAAYSLAKSNRLKNSVVTLDGGLLKFIYRANNLIRRPEVRTYVPWEVVV